MIWGDNDDIGGIVDHSLKKIAPSGGGAKIVGVFRVKNYDFTPKNYIFSNCGGRLHLSTKIFFIIYSYIYTTE
jgi:hypothetical protein